MTNGTGTVWPLPRRAFIQRRGQSYASTTIVPCIVAQWPG